jgi:hypothetical protein
MKNLKNKIISKINSEVESESNIHIDKMKLKLENLKSKNKLRKVSPFNFIKIHYLNFKDGYLNKFNFLLGVSVDLVLASTIMIPTFAIFVEYLRTGTIFYEISILYILFFHCLLSGYFSSRETELEIEINEIENKISNSEMRLKSAKSKLQNIFLDIGDTDISFNIDNSDKDNINFLNRYVDVSMLEDIKSHLDEKQIVRLLEKSGGVDIKYKELIELIKELDNSEKAVKNYNKLFPQFKTRKNKENCYA